MSAEKKFIATIQKESGCFVGIAGKKSQDILSPKIN